MFLSQPLLQVTIIHPYLRDMGVAKLSWRSSEPQVSRLHTFEKMTFNIHPFHKIMDYIIKVFKQMYSQIRMVPKRDVFY